MQRAPPLVLGRSEILQGLLPGSAQKVECTAGNHGRKKQRCVDMRPADEVDTFESERLQETCPGHSGKFKNVLPGHVMRDYNVKAIREKELEFVESKQLLLKVQRPGAFNKLGSLRINARWGGLNKFYKDHPTHRSR